MANRNCDDPHHISSSYSSCDYWQSSYGFDNSITEFVIPFVSTQNMAASAHDIHS
jgi:hypothetical protein